MRVASDGPRRRRISRASGARTRSRSTPTGWGSPKVLSCMRLNCMDPQGPCPRRKLRRSQDCLFRPAFDDLARDSEGEWELDPTSAFERERRSDGSTCLRFGQAFHDSRVWRDPGRQGREVVPLGSEQVLDAAGRRDREGTARLTREVRDRVGVPLGNHNDPPAESSPRLFTDPVVQVAIDHDHDLVFIVVHVQRRAQPLSPTTPSITVTAPADCSRPTRMRRRLPPPMSNSSNDEPGCSAYPSISIPPGASLTADLSKGPVFSPAQRPPRNQHGSEVGAGGCEHPALRLYWWALEDFEPLTSSVSEKMGANL